MIVLCLQFGEFLFYTVYPTVYYIPGAGQRPVDQKASIRLKG